MKNPVLAVGIPWFLSSAFLSTWTNTSFLRYFDSPFLHVFTRFFGSALIGLTSLILSKDINVTDIPDILKDTLIPGLLLMIGKLLFD